MKNLSDMVELLYLPFTDERVLSMLAELEFPIPVIDDDYHKSLIPSVTSFSDIKHTKLRSEVTFSEIGSNKSDNGLPVLSKLFIPPQVLDYPFNIKTGDSYQTIKGKIGKKADLRHKRADDLRIWILERQDGEKYRLVANFKDSSVLELSTLLISSFYTKFPSTVDMPNEE